jgi:hypothetical protein
MSISRSLTKLKKMNPIIRRMMKRKKYGNFLRNYSMLFIIGAFANYKSIHIFWIGKKVGKENIKGINLW